MNTSSSSSSSSNKRNGRDFFNPRTPYESDNEEEVELSYDWVKDEDVRKIELYECSLKWALVRTSRLTPKNVITPPKKKKARPQMTMTQWVRGDADESDSEDSQPPAFISNLAMLALLKSFDAGFKAALLGIELLYPEGGEQAVVGQRQWQQQVLSVGIEQLENCPIENIIWFSESDIATHIDAIRNTHFLWLITNLKKTRHFSFALDILPGQYPAEDSYYYAVVRHGEVDLEEVETTYHLYGTNKED